MYIVLIAFAGAFSLVWWLVSPLFLDKRVDEALPISNEMKLASKEMSAQQALQVPQATQSPLPILQVKETNYEATFTRADKIHNVVGKVFTLRESNHLYLRFEEFEATNGPDLYIYLTKPGTATGEGIKLSKLKGNIGNQNYEVPSDVDLTIYSKVVIYCKSFATDFGYAELKEI